jgi:hypothetical protein
MHLTRCSVHFVSLQKAYVIFSPETSPYKSKLWNQLSCTVCQENDRIGPVFKKGFATERVERHFLKSDVSTGNIALCCRQRVAFKATG